MNDNLTSPAAPLPIAADEAHVWKVRLDVGDARLEELSRLLAADERRRAVEFRLEAARRRFVIARTALRTVLGGYLGVSPTTVALDFDRNGKPRLGDPASNVDLRFNVAHSGNLALVVVTRFCEVGVDVEQLRSVRYAGQIARRYFHPTELQAIVSAAAAERDATFLRCWTAKEAVLKAVGVGIVSSLLGFRVPFDGYGDAGVRVPASPYGGVETRCWLERLSVGSNYMAAVAFVEAQRIVRLFDFD